MFLQHAAISQKTSSKLLDTQHLLLSSLWTPRLIVLHDLLYRRQLWAASRPAEHMQCVSACAEQGLTLSC